jgi:hypothetical protein
VSTALLAELTYEQAQKALEQQERQVTELRQRTGTLLAAAALTASFPERLQLRLAFGLRDVRERNGQRVDRLVRCLAISAVALVIQIACWTWALALP